MMPKPKTKKQTPKGTPNAPDKDLKGASPTEGNSAPVEESPRLHTQQPVSEPEEASTEGDQPPDEGNRKVSSIRQRLEKKEYKKVDVEIWDREGTSLGVEQAKFLLGWLSESEYAQMMREENPDIKAESLKFGDAYFKDLADEGVRLEKNDRNRPFTREWSRQIAQDILGRRWKFNGESIIIGRDGNCLSAQHRLVAVVFSHQMWEKDPHWKQAQYWPDGPPTIETIVVVGIDESPETTRTLDNVKPRTLGDVLYSSEAFAELTPKDRKNVTKLVDFCVRHLWSRTGRGNDAFSPKRTHSEALEFIQNHKYLLRAVDLIYKEESGKKAGAHLVPMGTASSLLYLMAASASDKKTYHDATPPSEEVIDFSQRELAEEFWKGLCGSDPRFTAVRKELGRLIDPVTQKHSGRVAERVCIVSKAWNAFRLSGGEEITEDDVDLVEHQEEDDKGKVGLIDVPTLGGIDLGDPNVKHKVSPEEEAETKARLAAEKEAKDKARVEKAGKLMANRQAKKDKKDVTKGGKTVYQILMDVKKEHPGKLLLFKGDKEYAAWGDDAAVVCNVLGTELSEYVDGAKRTTVPEDQVDEVILQLTEAGHTVGIAERKSGKTVVRLPMAEAGAGVVDNDDDDEDDEEVIPDEDESEEDDLDEEDIDDEEDDLEEEEDQGQSAEVSTPPPAPKVRKAAPNDRLSSPPVYTDSAPSTESSLAPTPPTPKRRKGKEGTDNQDPEAVAKKTRG